jgi:hypothetical protein
MDLPSDGLEWERRTGDPWKPSLDRIEGTRGYRRGNVRFVTVIANLAKSGFSDAAVIELCRDVVKLADQAGTRSGVPVVLPRLHIDARLHPRSAHSQRRHAVIVVSARDR